MAGPTRISQLTDGAPVQETDQIPVARGSGASGYTYKVDAGRLVSDLLNVTNTPSVNLSFDTSTRTLSADVSTAVKEASAFNVVDSSTINLDWNTSTRTLSANANYLLTLINTLSTNMQNIGNYPYLEYAWVTAPNAAGQTISSGIWNTLNLNTEVADTGNFGTLASNQITLAAGTYRFAAYTNLVLYYAAQTVFALYNVSDNKYISTISDQALSNYGGVFEGQFVLNSSKILDFRLGYSEAGGRSATIKEDNSYGHGHSISTSNSSFRTAIKLWKVG